MESCFSAVGVQGPQWSGLKSAGWPLSSVLHSLGGEGNVGGVGGEEGGGFQRAPTQQARKNVLIPIFLSPCTPPQGSPPLYLSCPRIWCLGSKESLRQ